MQANKALLLSNMLSSTNSVENADIASFEASCVTPLDITVDIDPVQDLHGYDNPWPGGGGVNKANLEGATNSTQHTLPLVTSFDTDSEIITISGKITPSITYLQYRFAVFPNIQNGLGLKAFKISSGAYADTLSWDGTTQTVVIIVRGLTAGQENDVNIKFHMVAYEGSTAPTSWTPYSNICPISGWDGAKVTRTGRNVLRPKYSGRTHNGVTYVVNDDGTITASGTASGSSYAVRNISTERELTSYLPAGTYRLTGGIDASKQLYLGGVYDDGTAFIVAYDRGEGATYTFTKGAWVYPQIVITNGTTINATFKIQLESGSTAHAYELYTAVTHEIPFSTSVYGGKLNVETGELVVDRAMVTLNGMERWTAHGDQGYWTAQNNMKKSTNYIGQIVCDKLPVFDHNYKDSYKSAEYGITGWGNDQAINQNYFYIKAGSTSATTIEDLRAWLQANPVTVVYPLATPITLTLDPVEIRSLLGDNNVWSDTGNVSVRNITCNADVLELLLKTKLIGDC